MIIISILTLHALSSPMQETVVIDRSNVRDTPSTHTTPIYLNGSMQGDWHQTAVGCRQCSLSAVSSDHYSFPKSRAGSSASFSIDMAERGHLRLTSQSIHPSER
jgi:hypothetical protein